jgi:putative nucleotidyltransferase with HDIG domain
MRRVLFVDDEPRVLDGLQRMLRSQRSRWEMVFAPGGEAALRELERASFDVVVTDMRMPGVDGSALLHAVAARSPDTVRIVLSGQTEFEVALRVLPIAHQFLMKPCEARSLEQAIEQSCRLRDLLRSDAMRKVVGGIAVIPVVPAVYAKLVEAVDDASSSLATIAKIVEQDGALASKVLQSVNSSFFGVGRRINSIAQAVSLLGVRLLRSLVLSQEILRPLATAPNGLGFDPDAEHDHALQVARIARRLAVTPAGAEEAAIAGLLHDVGKLLLYAYLPEQARAAIDLAAAKAIPRHDAEREILGVSHAEVGAYLLGLWGLPHTVVEAVAYHHSGEQIKHQPLGPATAVYLANLAVNTGNAPDDLASTGEVAAVLADERLAEYWRQARELTQETE